MEEDEMTFDHDIKLIPTYVWVILACVWTFFVASFFIGWLPFMIFMTVMGIWKMVKMTYTCWWLS